MTPETRNKIEQWYELFICCFIYGGAIALFILVVILYYKL